MIFCEVYSFHKPCCSSSKCLHTNRSHTYSQGGNSILLTYGLPHANYIWPATCQLQMAYHMPIAYGLLYSNYIWPAVCQLHMACHMPITYGLLYANYIWPAVCQLHPFTKCVVHNMNTTPLCCNTCVLLNRTELDKSL